MSVNCPACGVLNDREAAFCGGCGVALGLIGPSCGAGPLPAGVAFCTACGSELARPGVLLERKIVSVVFVDLVGFTAMSEALDPEEVRRLLGPYYQRVREELEGYGGTVEKFIGDAVMALFGAPVPTRTTRRTGTRTERRSGKEHRPVSLTNPAKEEQEYIDAIKRDVRWLGFDWGQNLFHASDYFEQLYQWAEHLISR